MIKLLVELIKAEEDLEAIRRSLKNRPLFETTGGYLALDEANKGEFGVKEVLRLLEDRHLNVEEYEVELLLHKWDKTGALTVNKNEFIREIRPKLI